MRRCSPCALALLLCLAACATDPGTQRPHGLAALVGTDVQAVIQTLGRPTASRRTKASETIYSWESDQPIIIPQAPLSVVTSVTTDGMPVFSFIPQAPVTYDLECTIELGVDPEGRITHGRSRGNDCDRFIRKLGP